MITMGFSVVELKNKRQKQCIITRLGMSHDGTSRSLFFHPRYKAAQRSNHALLTFHNVDVALTE